MTKDFQTSESELAFAKKMAELHEKLWSASEKKSATSGEVAVDPALARITPVLDLLEEARLCQELGSECLVDTRPVAETKDTADELQAVFDYGEAKTVGRFEIRELLGQGGFGVVFRATDPLLDRDVALKIPRFETSLSEESRQRFAREATAAAALSHPNIVAVYETGMHRGVRYIASELVSGDNLASWLQRSGPLSPTEAAKLVAKLAGAIEHAHRRGVLHRDLKPSNILIETDSGHPRISDFGLATVVDEAIDLTQSGAAVGTPAYMSPEQAAGDKAAMGPGTDVYGLGTILYYLLCGHSPIEGSTVVETLRRVAEKEPLSPRAQNIAVPSDLSAVCMKCLEKRPSDRYPSAFALQADLECFMQQVPVSARPISGWSRCLRWARRNPVIAGTSAAAVVFLLAAVAATTLGWLSTQQALAGETLAKREAEARTQEAEARYKEMKQAIDTYYRKVDDNAELKNLPGGEKLRGELLELALTYYQKFALDNQEDQELAIDIADTCRRSGQILTELGNYTEATKYFRRSLEIVDAELQANPVDESLVELRAQLLHDLARSSYSTGDLEASLDLGEQAWQLQRQLCDSAPDDRLRQQRLAEIARQRGIAFRSNSQMEQTIEQLQQTAAIYEKLLSDHEDRDLQFDMLSTKGEFANALRSVGKTEEAELLHSEVVQEAGRLAQADPTFWAAHKIFVIAVLQKSAFSFMRNDFESSLPQLEQARTTIQRLVWLHPGIDEYANLHGEILNRLSISAGARGDIDGALDIFDQLVRLARGRLAQDEGIIQAKFDLASALLNTVIFRLQHGLSLESVNDSIREAVQLSENLCQQQPENYDYLILRALALDTHSQVSLKSGEIDDAIDSANSSVGVLDRILKLNVNDPKVNYYAHSVYRHRAVTRQTAGRLQGARDDLKLALPLSPPPQAIETRLHLSLAHERLGESGEAKSLVDEILDKELRDSDLALLSKYFALAAGNSEGQQRNDLLAKAMTSLQQLAKQGYYSEISRVADLESNPDYAALANNEGFANSIRRLRRSLAQE